MPWAAIADGAHDSEIDALAAKLKSMPTVLLSFSHEPEHDYGSHGSPADFVAAFRHVHDRLIADGATNVRYVWDVEGLTDPVWLARYASLWPGASYVDWVAWDPYNWASCRTGRAWQSFARRSRRSMTGSTSHGYGTKPFMLAEYGSVEKTGDPNGKAAWFAGIPGGADIAAEPAGAGLFRRPGAAGQLQLAGHHVNVRDQCLSRSRDQPTISDGRSSEPNQARPLDRHRPALICSSQLVRTWRTGNHRSRRHLGWSDCWQADSGACCIRLRCRLECAGLV